MPTTLCESVSSFRAVLLPPPCDLEFFRAQLTSDGEVLAVLVLGSVARGDHVARSDLDLVVLAQPGAATAVTRRLRESASSQLPRQIAFPEKSKVVFYSADITRKSDVFVVEDLSAVSRYVAGSRILATEDAIVFDRTGAVASWLQTVPPEVDDFDVVVPEQIARFAYHLERASSLHAAGDMYRAHFNLEIALHCVVNLHWRASGRVAFAWCPRDLLKDVPKEVADALRQHQPTMDPSRFHACKLHMLEMFRAALVRLGRASEPLLAFCGDVLERDRWWNHRDAGLFTSEEIPRGVIFRSSSPHRFAGDPEYLAWLSCQRLGVRIDLRGAHEKAENPVPDLGIEVIEAPIDPWRDFTSDDPIREGVAGDEAAYRFSALRCGHALRAVVERVARGEGSVWVHCHAGADRTGVIVALAHGLAGVPRGEVLAGYSASSDARRTAILSRTLDLVDAHGGVVALALRAGLEDATIAAFRHRVRP